MPLYDYECSTCGNEFTIDLSIEDHARKEKDRQIHCPKCDSTEVKHIISSVFVTTSKKS